MNRLRTSPPVEGEGEFASRDRTSFPPPTQRAPWPRLRSQPAAHASCVSRFSQTSGEMPTEASEQTFQQRGQTRAGNSGLSEMYALAQGIAAGKHAHQSASQLLDDENLKTKTL